MPSRGRVSQINGKEMKKLIILSLILLCSPLGGKHGGLSAQAVKFGYLSYDNVLRQMPEYAMAKQNVATLKVKYDQEATRSEEEFQRKFSEFLQGQKDFPENILIKRQAELQALMESSLKFRQEASELLSKAEEDMMDVVRAKLNEAIQAIGAEKGYGYIINTDGNACPFIHPQLGDNVTLLVMQKLGLEVPQTEEEVTTDDNELGNIE